MFINRRIKNTVQYHLCKVKNWIKLTFSVTVQDGVTFGKREEVGIGRGHDGIDPYCVFVGVVFCFVFYFFVYNKILKYILS